MPEITYALLKPIIVKEEPGEHNMIQPSGMRRISFFGLLLLALAGCASAQLTTPEAHRAADIWQASCSFCHGIDGKGNPALGAPDLTDSAWLYGSSEAVITETLTKGRNGQMPAHGPLIGADAVKIVAGYVYSLRDQAQTGQAGGAR